MEGYRKSSHAVYRCEYHFVWVPKYSYHVLVNEIKPRLKAILAELCEWLDITFICNGTLFNNLIDIKLFGIRSMICQEQQD